jgi:hypothetical protein
VDTLNEEASVRTALTNYLLIVKEYYATLYPPPVLAKIEALFPPKPSPSSNEPQVIQLVRAEKHWLNELSSCLNTIEQMLTNLERWRSWFLDLVENLEFSSSNIQTLTKGPDVVLEELQSQKLDDGYIRLVVNNATADFMELIPQTRQLLDELVQKDEYIKSLKSPVLEIVEQRLSRLKDLNYPELLNQMQQLIAATYNAPTKENFLDNLSKLLHIFGGWRRMLQLEDPELDSPRAMEQFLDGVRNTVNTMTQLTRAFDSFIKARNLADYYVLQAELSLIRMMLTYEGHAESWWGNFMELRPEQVTRVIPEQLDPHQLLIGVTHSLALLEDLENRLLPEMPSIKTTIGRLSEFLQSPAVKLYEEIYQTQLSTWSQYEPQWVHALIQLRGQLHALIKKHGRLEQEPIRD